MWSFLEEQGVRGNLVATAALFAVLLVVRFLTKRAMRQLTTVSPELRRRWLGIVRNISIIVFILFVTVLWASELRTFALGLVAVAAALAISTKEMTLCALGGLLRGSNRLFDLGDRIQVGETRGDVIEIGLLTTTLLEVGPGRSAHQSTGRAVTLPNALFLSHPVINETYTQRYVIHTHVVPIKKREWARAREVFLATTLRECDEFIAPAREHFTKLATQHALPTPSAIPRVQLEVDPTEGYRLLVRFPAPTTQRGNVEQAILVGALAELDNDHDEPAPVA